MFFSGRHVNVMGNAWATQTYFYNPCFGGNKFGGCLAQTGPITNTRLDNFGYRVLIGWPDKCHLTNASLGHRLIPTGEKIDKINSPYIAAQIFKSILEKFERC